MNQTSVHRKWGNVTVVIAALLVASLLPAHGQSYTLKQALGYPFPYGLTAATHANRVAWVFDLRGSRNVWIADGPDFIGRQLTHYSGDDGMPISSLRLTPDGRTVVYARGAEANAHDVVADPTNSVHKPVQQVWAVDVLGGSPRLLGTMNCLGEGCEDIQISPDGKYAVWSGAHKLWLAPVSGDRPARPLGYIRGDAFQPQWSPNSKRIAFVSKRGTHSLIGVYRFGSSTIHYIDPGVFYDQLPRWSPDGSKLAFIRVMGTGNPFLSDVPQPWAIQVWSAGSGKTRVIWQSSDDARGSFPDTEGEWEADAFRFASNKRIVFASQEDGWMHLYSIATGGGTPVLLTPGKFSFIGRVVLTADGKALLYASNENDVDRRHIWRVSVDHPGAAELTHGTSLEWSPVVTGTGHDVVFLGSTATKPAMPYRLTRHGYIQIAASALPDDYPSSRFVTPKDIVFKSPDGLMIHGQLFVPSGHPQHAPGLVFLHGGPFRQMLLGFHPMDAYNYMYAVNQYLASRGFVVLSVNYRTSIMYGFAFRQPAHWGPWGASEYQDVVAGAKYLQAMPQVDQHKIGLWGASYGGYLTAMGLAHDSEIFKAGVDYAGVHDWPSFIGRKSEIPAKRKVAYEASPISSMDSWKSPVLLMQADDDRVVHFSQTADLVKLLRQHDIPYQLIVFPDGVHDSLLWRTWVRNFAATARFFQQTLVGGKAVKTVPAEYAQHRPDAITMNHGGR